MALRCYCQTPSTHSIEADTALRVSSTCEDSAVCRACRACNTRDNCDIYNTRNTRDTRDTHSIQERPCVENGHAERELSSRYYDTLDTEVGANRRHAAVLRHGRSGPSGDPTRQLFNPLGHPQLLHHRELPSHLLSRHHRVGVDCAKGPARGEDRSKYPQHSLGHDPLGRPQDAHRECVPPV